VDHHHLRRVLLGDGVVPARVGDPAKPGAETEAVGLGAVVVARRCRDLDGTHAIGRLRRKPDDLVREAPQVLEHDRVGVQTIAGAEKGSTGLEAALGHPLDHHVDIAAVVEMAVAQNDAVEAADIDLALGVLHHGTRTGIKSDPRSAILEVDAPRGGELLRHHEAGTGGAHECEVQRSVEVKAPPSNGARIGVPDRRLGNADASERYVSE
jgi:hypothetical protein